MRVAISSTAGLDRKGLIDCFIMNWGNYTLDNSWKKAREDLPDDISQPEMLKQVLIKMNDLFKKHGRNDNIIYNRCGHDVMAYMMWGYTVSPDIYTEEYIEECIDIYKESLKCIDIVFYIPLSQVSNNTDQPEDVRRVDNSFKFLKREYEKKTSDFFVHDDRPALIELVGNIEQQIHIIKLYLDEDGSESKDNEILPPEILNLMSTDDLDITGEINGLLKTK